MKNTNTSMKVNKIGDCDNITINNGIIIDNVLYAYNYNTLKYESYSISGFDKITRISSDARSNSYILYSSFGVYVIKLNDINDIQYIKYGSHPIDLMININNNIYGATHLSNGIKLYKIEDGEFKHYMNINDSNLYWEFNSELYNCILECKHKSAGNRFIQCITTTALHDNVWYFKNIYVKNDNEYKLI
ncbi:MAG: hypothetical protein ACRCXT_17420 [Paraclostridium sp.]